MFYKMRWRISGAVLILHSVTDKFSDRKCLRCGFFVGKQIDIAQAFGFEIPEGSGTKYKSRKVKEKKLVGLRSKKRSNWISSTEWAKTQRYLMRQGL